MLISEIVKINQRENREEYFSCGKCKCERRHKILVSVYYQYEETYDKYDHQVIQCLGCKHISFRYAVYKHFQPCEAISENIYPDSAQRLAIEGVNLLNDDIKDIYKETLETINNNQVILFGMGIRTILEAITKEQKTPGIDLNQKIKNLVKQGLVAQKDVRAIHYLRQIGNEATHSIKPPSSREIKFAMDEIEHLLQTIYILPYDVKENLLLPLKNKPNTVKQIKKGIVK